MKTTDAVLDSNPRILLVEDNDLDALVIKRLLRKLKLNYPIVRANNGEEALHLLRSQASDRPLEPPFTMIVDISMPRMNGFELLDEVIDDSLLANVPIYILSSSGSSQDKNRAGQYRIRGYAVKPLTAPVLLDILEIQDAA